MERGQRARLSQKEFASRFKISVGTLRDWEQTRSTTPDFAIAYVKVISSSPGSQGCRSLKFNIRKQGRFTGDYRHRSRICC